MSSRSKQIFTANIDIFTHICRQKAKLRDIRRTMSRNKNTKKNNKNLSSHQNFSLAFKVLRKSAKFYAHYFADQFFAYGNQISIKNTLKIETVKQEINYLSAQYDVTKQKSSDNKWIIIPLPSFLQLVQLEGGQKAVSLSRTPQKQS